jgi:hypothetical protein
MLEQSAEFPGALHVSGSCRRIGIPETRGYTIFYSLVGAVLVVVLFDGLDDFIEVPVAENNHIIEVIAKLIFSLIFVSSKVDPSA